MDISRSEFFFRGMATMIVVFALLWVGTRAIENFKPSNASTVRFVYLLHITLPLEYFYCSVFDYFSYSLRRCFFWDVSHVFALHFASFRFWPRYHMSQSRQSAKLLLQSLELELPHPLTRRQCAPRPPPLWFRGGGGAHSLAGEGYGGWGGS